jgi:ribonucleoside-diphosphate reductase alpha chain
VVFGRPIAGLGHARLSSVPLRDLAFEWGLLSRVQDDNSGDRAREARRFTRGVLRVDCSTRTGLSRARMKKGSASGLPRTTKRFSLPQQRMLLRLGIVSVLYRERHPQGVRADARRPNGGAKDYLCKATHELVGEQRTVLRSSRGVLDSRTPPSAFV